MIDILASNPEVWSKMALFITYDEEGGFFDHLVPPTPPQSPAHGQSTVAITNEIFGGDLEHSPGPYGLGVRVPMLVVSPWSRGGWVNSQLFDHTSLIRFLEARFAIGHRRSDLVETNITPWRRAVVGDLTTAFDFRTPNASRRLTLPSTDGFKPEALVRHPDEVPVPPVNEAMPQQEAGIRPARALPYALDARGALQSDAGLFWIRFRNTGEAGAVFQVRSGNSADVPRSYTVEPHKQLSGSWEADEATGYDLAVYGPNGFYRAFKGTVSGRHRANLEVRAVYDEDSCTIVLELSNRASQSAGVRIANRYTSLNTRFTLRPGESGSKSWSLRRTSGWYDLSITVDEDPQFQYHCAGHLEDGEDSVSDPLMGGLV